MPSILLRLTLSQEISRAIALITSTVDLITDVNGCSRACHNLNFSATASTASSASVMGVSRRSNSLAKNSMTATMPSILLRLILSQEISKAIALIISIVDLISVSNGFNLSDHALNFSATASVSPSASVIAPSHRLNSELIVCTVYAKPWMLA